MLLENLINRSVFVMLLGYNVLIYCNWYVFATVA